MQLYNHIAIGVFQGTKLPTWRSSGNTGFAHDRIFLRPLCFYEVVGCSCVTLAKPLGNGLPRLARLVTLAAKSCNEWTCYAYR